MLYTLIVLLLYLFWFVVLFSILISWDKFVRHLHLCFSVFSFCVSNSKSYSCLLLVILYHNDFYGRIINLLLFCCIVLDVHPSDDLIHWDQHVIHWCHCFWCFCSVFGVFSMWFCCIFSLVVAYFVCCFVVLFW